MFYYLSLGSNQGEKIKYLKACKYLIERDLGESSKESSYYETEPVDMKKGTEDFINQIIVVESLFKPREFLNITKEIEKTVGRRRKNDKKDRVIDIDIIFIDDLVINEKDFVVPHNEMHLRNFVLVPFVEIDDEFVHPVFKKSISELLDECGDKNTVKKI